METLTRAELIAIIETLTCEAVEAQQRITELENGLIRREAELDQIDTRNSNLLHRIAELTNEVNELEIECNTYLEMAHEAMWHHVGFDDRRVR